MEPIYHVGEGPVLSHGQVIKGTEARAFKQVKSGSVALCPFAITPIANIFNTPRNPIE